ncbi:MAG: UDP-N-acetylglucosamine 1-carboxyvinyltransferase [Verrucomicrobiales bacterium]|nr:UDP-N-acetylglucosamine 1-carboxyvinyltransferase [Verrucomicrobiales bacterium]
MYSLVINGGRPLRGEVQISGAKNAVLPILAATLLTPERCVLRRVPDLSDVNYMARILTELGAKVRVQGGTIAVAAERVRGVAGYDLVRKMRGSICVLGPLLARLREAQVSLPGGCVIGARPIDLHLKGLRGLGASITIEKGFVCAKARRLTGAELFLGGRSGPTVLGTANVLMAAVLAEGVTVIESAACEPEVVDLAHFLVAMGAKIEGVGSPTLRVTGVRELHGAEHEVIPDRIEAATFAVAAAATQGEVTLRGARPEHLTAVLDKLQEAGTRVRRVAGGLTVTGGRRPRPTDVTTQPYAGFPTDAQAQMMVLMTQAPGISILTERIYESRFMHVSELARLGADITLEGPSAVVKGATRLSGAPVMASDLRASAALVLAGLVAQGETRVRRIYHLDRGYERLDEKLAGLGAQVRRVAE